MPSDTLDATFSVWFKVDDYTKQSGLFNAYDDTSVAALGGFSCAINTSNGLYSYNRLECYIGGFSSTVKMRNWNLPVNVNDHQWHNLIVRFFQSG